jgi:WD40 repeat protein
MQLRPTIFEAINDTDRQKDMQVLMNGIRSHVSAVACHPTKSLVAFAIGEGYLQLWDYVNRKDYFNDFSKADISGREKQISSGEKSKPGEKKKYQFYSCIKFTEDGKELLIGRSDGHIAVFDPEANEFKKLSAGDLMVSDADKKNPDAVTEIVVSHCGNYFATSDTNNCVSLFKKDHLYGDKNTPREWQFNGKIMSHQLEITGLAFGEDYDE